MNTTVDVAVVGAGSAGAAAAVAAAESGARTALYEASGQVGGTLAWQLLEHSAGFHDTAGVQAVGGFGQRLVDRMREFGVSPGHIRDDAGYTATRTPINHAELALTEAAMLADAGVRVSLHSPVVDVTREGTRIAELVTETRSGTKTARPGVVVDCSGDAVVAARGGVPCHTDAVDARQPASLTFKLGGVDFGPLLAYAKDHPEDLREGNIVGDPAAEHVNLWGFGALLVRGHMDGKLSLSRHEMHLAGWPRRDEAVVNVTRVPSSSPDEDWMGDAYLALARQVLELAAWFRTDVPGCANAYVAAVADRIGVRESRRVIGHYTLTADDVLGARRFPEAIARGAFPIDIHDSRSATMSHTDQLVTTFDIPYGCLVADGVDNLLLGGRCVSSTHEANGSVRITASCFATGEAAGVAAALATRDGRAAHAVDLSELRATLNERGAIL